MCLHDTPFLHAVNEEEKMEEEEEESAYAREGSLSLFLVSVSLWVLLPLVVVELNISSLHSFFYQLILRSISILRTTAEKKEEERSRNTTKEKKMFFPHINSYVAIFVLFAFLGAATTFFSFGILFRKAEAMFDDVIYKKTLHHREREAVAMDAAVVPPAKVETICEIASFNDGIVGERAFRCRAVIFGQSITFYAVDKLLTRSDYRQSVVHEHLLGKINIDCVTSRSMRISRYHRHLDTSTRVAPMKGKVTMITAKDGLPLFLSNPNETKRDVLGYAAGEEMREEQRQQRAKERTKQQQQPHNKHSRSRSPTPGHRQGSHQSSGSHHAEEAHSSEEHVSYCSAGGKWEVDLLRTARSIIIKFPSLRENERWINLLNGTRETERWKKFLFHLPCNDVLNILIARIFVENTRTSYLDDMLRAKVAKKIEQEVKSMPSVLDGTQIFLDSLSIGTEIPLVNNVSDPVFSNSGDLHFDFDFLYRGGLTFVIRFDVTYRGWKVKGLGFVIQLLELFGRIRFHVGPPPSKRFFLGMPQMPQLDIQVTQQDVRNKGFLHWLLKIMPNLSGIARKIVRNALFEDMVLPAMDDFPFPMIGEPGSSSDAEEDDDESGKEGKELDEEEEEEENDDEGVPIQLQGTGALEAAVARRHAAAAAAAHRAKAMAAADALLEEMNPGKTPPQNGGGGFAPTTRGVDLESQTMQLGSASDGGGGGLRNRRAGLLSSPSLSLDI
eukprot:gene595-324_t